MQGDAKMVIWINGAFGSGKTTAAMLLHSKIENSYVYDPENVGTFLCSNMPSWISFPYSEPVRS